MWTQGIFGLSRSALTELLCALSAFDCAVFVFAPDDMLSIRGIKKPTARDNVLFELGLFTGRLGPGRTFAVTPSDVKNFHVPSDLIGVTLAHFRSKRFDNNVPAALGTACNQIRRELETLSVAMAASVPNIKKLGFFGDFNDEWKDLLSKSQRVDLYFIHSRRWRENHLDQIKAFLNRRGASLVVHLPNLRNKTLIKAIQEHFDDGPQIPAFIKDAYSYFGSLRKQFPKKVKLASFDTYPSYSFYKFDDEIIVAMYPTTVQRRSVPTFHFQVCAKHPFGRFVMDDLKQLSSPK